MYVLSCFPSFGHRRSGASVVAQRDPVGLWMVNHRLPSNFYNEVDGWLHQNPRRSYFHLWEMWENHKGRMEKERVQSHSLQLITVAPSGAPRSPEPKSICVTTSLYKAPVIQTQLWIGSRWNHLHLVGKKNYRECCIPGLGCWHTE